MQSYPETRIFLYAYFILPLIRLTPLRSASRLASSNFHPADTALDAYAEPLTSALSNHLAEVAIDDHCHSYLRLGLGEHYLIHTQQAIANHSNSQAPTMPSKNSAEVKRLILEGGDLGLLKGLSNDQQRFVLRPLWEELNPIIESVEVNAEQEQILAMLEEAVTKNSAAGSVSILRSKGLRPLEESMEETYGPWRAYVKDTGSTISHAEYHAISCQGRARDPRLLRVGDHGNVESVSTPDLKQGTKDDAGSARPLTKWAFGG